MKKKLLFVINTLGRAGAETALLALLNSFSSSEYEIFLYVLLEQGELFDELPPHVHLLNVGYSSSSVLSDKGRSRLKKTVVKKAVSHFSLIRNLPYLAGNAVSMIKNKKFLPEKLLWKVVSDGSRRFTTEFDLAIAYIEGGAAYYVSEHVRAKKKAAFIHIDYSKAGYNRQLDLSCFDSFDRIFAVSDEVKASFLKVYPSCSYKTKVFHNLLDTKRIIKKSHERIKDMPHFQHRREVFNLLTVGRLTYQKGFDVAIHALRIIIDNGYPVHWYIIGEGPEYRDLKDLADLLGVSDNIHFLGVRDNPYPYFCQADIYVHATRFEGKSIAIQEAQALGCAIIASDCSGNREQITNHEDGLLCAFSASSIAAAVIYLFEQPEKISKYRKMSAQKQINHFEELEYIKELL